MRYANKWLTDAVRSWCHERGGLINRVDHSADVIVPRRWTSHYCNAQI